MIASFLHAESRWLHEFEHGAPRAQAHAALRLAELARLGCQHERALRLLRAVVHDGDALFAPRAAFELGDVMERELGRPYGAEQWFELAAELSRPGTTPDVHNNVASRRAAAGRYAEAVALYGEVIDACAGSDVAALREEAAVAGCRLGDLLAEQGLRAEAETAWRAVLASDEDEAVVHAALALALLLTDELARQDEAAALLEAVIRTDHSDGAPLAALRLAQLCELRDDDARATELYERVVACEHPEHAPVASEALRSLRERQLGAYLTRVLERGLTTPATPQQAPADMELPARTDFRFVEGCLHSVTEVKSFRAVRFETATVGRASLLTTLSLLMDAHDHRRALVVSVNWDDHLERLVGSAHTRGAGDVSSCRRWTRYLAACPVRPSRQVLSRLEGELVVSHAPTTPVLDALRRGGWSGVEATALLRRVWSEAAELEPRETADGDGPPAEDPDDLLTMLAVWMLERWQAGAPDPRERPAFATPADWSFYVDVLVAASQFGWEPDPPPATRGLMLPT